MNARETADDYAGTLVEFGGWRIVRCKDDIQWIVQKDRRRGTPRFDARPWVAVAYLLDERFLAAVISRPSLGVPDNTLATLLAALPEHIAGGAGDRSIEDSTPLVGAVIGGRS